MKEIVITDKISYVECTEDPLSADIGIIRDGEEIWLYDVGNDMRSLEGLSGQYNIVLSHFHQDHVGSIKKLGIKRLYVSKETQKHIAPAGVIVEEIYMSAACIFFRFDRVMRREAWAWKWMEPMRLSEMPYIAR
jgi:glyoxylase-like metal-dependent hydrolase (beta-lactamase superfamily II)